MWRRGAVATLVTVLLLPMVGATFATVAGATTSINGVGSSYAAPAIEQWAAASRSSPYNLGINYSSTSSGDARYEFANDLSDFGITDIAYGLGSVDTTPPSFPFIYVPVLAEGVAFMYNIPGLNQTLQLTSYTACAIMTGGITNWDSPLLEQGGANDGSNLSTLNIPIVPVTESDTVGTNYAMEDWCIDEQPVLWAAFVNQEENQPGGPSEGVTLSSTAPNANWPGISTGLGQQNTSGVATDTATNNGAIGFVETRFAIGQGFGNASGVNTNPAKGMVSVGNLSGDFTQPTGVDVDSALTYATENSNGTVNLDFTGVGANVYNPSTVDYLLTPTTGWESDKGATLSGFVNYALTVGQQIAPQIGYANLGLPLEQAGINEVTADVPGAVPLTPDEQTDYECGDLTTSDVALGETTPSCSPGTGTPEVPYALALPVLAFGIMGGAVYARRRRSRQIVPANTER